MKALSTIALASLFLIPAAYADHHGDKMGKGPGTMMDCPLTKPAMQKMVVKPRSATKPAAKGAGKPAAKTASRTPAKKKA